MELSLSEQISILERKAERFDEVVDRIMDLKDWTEDFESGETSGKGLTNKLKSLINIYEPSSRYWIAKVEKQGYQQGKLEKYPDSKLNGEIIIEVKATKEGKVFALTETGEHAIGHMSDGCNFKQSLDYILCDIQHMRGLELIK